MMTKSDAINLFGGSVKDLAAAYRCERQAIYQWPEELPDAIALRVIGAAVLAGIRNPASAWSPATAKPDRKRDRQADTQAPTPASEAAA